MEEHLFERLAHERGITVQEMQEIISARIEKGWNDLDSETRAQWRRIPCAGEIPTPDEWLKYVAEKFGSRGAGVFIEILIRKFSRGITSLLNNVTLNEST